MKLVLASFILILSYSASAQRTYIKEWKRIDSLIEKAGLIKTALKETNNIYGSAKKENNDVQVIKALVYRMSLNDQLSDSGRYENIALLEKEIAAAKEPARSILHSIAGGSYWTYLQMNRWQFYNRSNTKGYDDKDISTWSLEQLYERITDHFAKSLAPSKMLMSAKLGKFDPLIIKGNARNLRPTLFDLLAFRALDYFRNDERYITKPAYAFEINDSIAFADATTFIDHKFKTSDSLSLHHKALEVYQQLLSFHINDAKPDALIDGDIDRLQFVKNFGINPDKDELIKRSVEKIISKYNSSAVTAPALLYLAGWYLEKGRNYDPLGDTSNRYLLNKAKELCLIISGFKIKNESSSNSRNLIRQIEHLEISMKAEVVNTRNDPFRILVNYRNITTAYFRIIRFDRTIREKLGREKWTDEYWKKVADLPVIKTYTFNLPATNDHQQHWVEVKIDTLPVGEYGILVSPDKNFSPGKNPMALHLVNVSDISFIHNNTKYYVLNRKNGAPLAAAKVQVWEEYYSNSDKTEKLRKLESYVSDANGFFELKKSTPGRPYRNIRFEITHGNDKLFLDRESNIYLYDGSENTKDIVTEQTFLFTDRSIYRPGQTVYFKGILVANNGKEKNHAVIPGRKTKVVLFDANGEQADSISVTTNEFGSYSGKFILPMGLMNGEFTINDENTDNDTRIFVEEYKRPKFFVEIAPPKGTYRVNDVVKVEGNAKSYAGNSINGATVQYRVFRNANIPLWYSDYMPRIWPPYPQQEKVIIYGTTTTDENGKFFIAFPAIPDNAIPKSAYPVFNYSVYADVTDINGETIRSNTSVRVAYESMKLLLDLPSRLHTDSLKNLTVRSSNMNDSFEKAEVKLSLFRLNAPSKIFRERYWEQPDQFVMSRDEYYANFPLDLYSDESNKVKWSKGKPVAEISGTTSADGKFKVPGKITEPGWYLIEASTKDKYGDTVQDKKYVLLYNEKIISPESVAMLEADKTNVQPGEKVKYNLKTNIGEVNVIHEVVKNKNAKTDFINTSKNEIGPVLNISDSDRGSIIVKVAFVKNNRFYTDNLTIGVPFKNKELKIDYITFRDRTLPGSGEKWKVKVSGLKGDKVAAELLTSMYDASLDELHKHQWTLPNIWSMENDYSAWNGKTDFFAGESEQRNNYEEEENLITKEYDKLKTTEEQVFYARDSKLYGARAPSVAANGMMRTLQGKVQGVAVVTEAAANQSNEINDTALDQTYNKNFPPPSIQPRKNLNETAFFFPDLQTDSAGNVEFSFTSPEALTTWKWMLLAYTKDLSYAYGEKSIVTQKQLMVQPNAPRFLREGDSIDFSVKVVNMSAKAISGLASLQLFDPSTGKEVMGMINKIHQSIKFNAPSGQSVPLSFTIKIPATYAQPLTWRVIATADTKDVSLSDGEEDIIPVLSNRMLVTETITLPVRGQKTKSFKFEKLLKSGTGTSLKNKALTIEFTSNPAWYAVQALPYLSEAKDENAEQIFNRYYANALASKLANSFPKLKSIIEKWKNSDTSAFLSNLQKNQDLKNILLEETPWVLEAKTESQQKKNIALLFDVVRMSQELKSALDKLIEMQTEPGAFTWNKGGYPDRYMTQYIISGLGKLQKLGAIPTSDLAKINILTSQAIAYLDNEIKRDYDLLKKNNKKIPGTYIGYDPIHYLYMRSFFKDVPVPGQNFAAYNYIRDQVKQGWVKQNTYMRAMIALSLQRTGDPQTAKKIIAALKESAISNDEMGMYWKDMNGGYYWYQAPVETQSVLIEAFTEIAGDNNAVADLKTWLLRNKQTNSWKTSKSTADACYALLLQGENWLDDETPVTIQLGEKTISSPAHAEAGTGYFRTSIPGDSIKPSMGNITVKLQSYTNSQPSWGGVYWQYFEDLDKITSATTVLKIEKKLFVQKNTDRGAVIEATDNNNTLHVGDKVKVRIVIRTDRNMEYVHLKDMRSSSMEPVNVLSEYKWKSGLGYYESTKDASTNFFFSYLPKGTHVFEYDLFVTHTGRFSNGVATIQCMYAPEFSSHSEGIKVNVVK